jgi:hypothetical protein
MLNRIKFAVETNPQSETDALEMKHITLAVFVALATTA